MILTVWYKIEIKKINKQKRIIIRTFCPISGIVNICYPDIISPMIERDRNIIERDLFNMYSNWKNFDFQFKEIK